MIRTHVMLPADLVRELDQVVEKRKRSAFVEEAVRERLLRERQLRQIKLLCATSGILHTGGPPEWSTPEGTSGWVRALRDQDEARRPRRDY